MARYDSKFKSFYKRLAKKKPKTVAKTATARKVLVKLVIMLRDQITAAEFDQRGRISERCSLSFKVCNDRIVIELVHLLPAKGSRANPNIIGKKALRNNTLRMPEEMNAVSQRDFTQKV